ncbi:MAG: response regulator [Bacteroidales bacterium]
MNISNLELIGKNIIIVEDDPSSSRYYEAILISTGANFKIFHTGKEFVDYLTPENKNIDLVIMDFLIPLINGIDCVKIFRKERKSTPVIIITAYYSEQARTEAFIVGCNEYLLKPIYPEKVLYLLNKYLSPNISVTFSN